MKKKDAFFVGYAEKTPKKIKQTIRIFIIVILIIIIIIALAFVFSQNSFKNSSFELTKTTKIVGLYHESPYPMLKVQTSENSFKNILLLGFGKAGAHPFLKKIKKEHADIIGKTLQIEGNLIYYNSKTLLQITPDKKITLLPTKTHFSVPALTLKDSSFHFQGEIVDPKCYFGVMKPGKGKVHRSCAVRCISGGIPPVFALSDKNSFTTKYYLIADEKGNPINKEILPFIGKPLIIKGNVYELEDWMLIKINTKNIEDLKLPSAIYSKAQIMFN